MTRAPLAGRSILVTRPRERAEHLAALIREAGGEAVLFPSIAIDQAADPQPLRALIDRLETLDLAIFVSPSAVEKALEAVAAQRRGEPWPARVRVAAIGAGTRRALERRGFAGVIAPRSGADSEALLTVPELAEVAGWRIAILRGAHGRALLGEVLASRGAHVEYAECYARTRPAADAAPLLARWNQGAIDAVTVSSSEGLGNLLQMLGEEGARLLRKTPLFVPHARVAAQAARLGLGQARVAGPADDEMIACLMAYFRTTP
jgi:uroporphyrinogen-III synthase